MLEFAPHSDATRSALARASVSVVENERRRSRTLSCDDPRNAASGKRPTRGKGSVDNTTFPLVGQKRTIDEILIEGILSGWRRRAESQSGIHTPPAGFFCVPAGDQVGAVGRSLDILSEFRSDVEVNFSLPLFGRRRIKCTVTHKLPFALFGFCAPGATRSFFSRRRRRYFHSDRTGELLSLAPNQTELKGVKYAYPD